MFFKKNKLWQLQPLLPPPEQSQSHAPLPHQNNKRQGDQMAGDPLAILPGLQDDAAGLSQRDSFTPCSLSYLVRLFKKQHHGILVVYGEKQDSEPSK
jgi:hypothetical protein